MTGPLLRPLNDWARGLELAGAPADVRSWWLGLSTCTQAAILAALVVLVLSRLRR